MTPANAPLLILSSCEKICDSLARILGNTWTIHQAANQHEAVALLTQHAISVVIADGYWRELLEFVSNTRWPPSVLVTAPFADEALWAEVLNRGGYDVLAQPFESNEVLRITQAALRRSRIGDYHGLRGPAVIDTA